MEILTYAQLHALDLTDDQADGIDCIACGDHRGAMEPVETPSNPLSPLVFIHPKCPMPAVAA